jgi:hypothetical protein
MAKKVQQPIITQKELNKVKSYLRRVKKEGSRPWATVRSTQTNRQGQIIFSNKTNRTHHFLSRGELQPFFHFEASTEVSEILEQYPLDINQTLAIAEELNIVHPGSYEEAVEFDGHKPAKTMSIDYVIKHTDGSLHAYNFKYASSLDPKLTSPVAVARTEAKATIERLYCRRHDMTWTQLTEENFNKSVTQNLKFLREFFDFKDEVNISDDIKSLVLCQFKIALENHSSCTLRTLLENVSSDSKLPLHQIQSLFQMFVYTRLIDFDWTVELDLNRPLPLVIKDEVYAG